MIHIKEIFLYLIAFLFFSHQNFYSQSNKNGSAKFSDEEFILDGIDNEKIWESSEIITNFNSSGSLKCIKSLFKRLLLKLS